MAVSVWAVFCDGREKLLRDGAEFADAIEHAIELTDRFCSEPDGGPATPQSVHVRRNGEIALSLTVLRGGLA